MTRNLLLSAVALVSTAALAQQASTDDVFMARVAEMVAGRGEFKGYSPLETVPGASKVTSYPHAVTPVIAPAALATARDYAAHNNSSAYIVWHAGKIVDEAYFGKADATTPIVSKSLAKPITALAIGRAIALGKIRSLDQPVSDFITEWKGKPQGAMLIRHILDMRSGLLAQNFDTKADNPWNRSYLDPDHMAYIINHYPLTDAPGSIYQYSNATSELVALVIERATRRRYAEFVGTEVLKPIGAPGGKVWLNRPGGLAHSGCCMMLPAQSWLRMAVLIMNDGVWNGRALLPRGYVAAMRTGSTQNPHYGLGLWLAGTYLERRGFQGLNMPGSRVLHSAPYLARDLVLFDGNSDQVVYIVPSAKLIILRTGDAPPKTPEWDNAFLPNTILRGMSYNGPPQQ